MKTALILFGLVGVFALYLLATLHSLRRRQAWVPFSTSLDARLELRRENRPIAYWLVTCTHAAIAMGALAILLRLVFAASTT